MGPPIASSRVRRHGRIPGGGSRLAVVERAIDRAGDPPSRIGRQSRLRSHACTQPALAFVGSRDSALSALPPQRIAL